MKHGKKYVDSRKAVDASKQYASEEALGLVCENAKAKFDETVEAHIRLGVDSRHADQQVRGAVVLPNGTGKTVRVCVFCKEDKYEAAKAAGADFVGGQDLVDKITKENWMDFDVVIASPDMMGLVGRLGKILGPRGLMPTPKSGTVTNEIGNAVKEVKQGKIDFKVDKSGIVHTSIGKISFNPDQIRDNAKEFISTLLKLKPSAAKGTYIKSIYLSSTMSAGIKIAPKSVEEN